MTPPPATGTLAGLAERWFDEKRFVGRGISANTEAAYRRDLTAWATRIADGLGRDPSPDPGTLAGEAGRLAPPDLTRDAVISAMAGLARDDLSPRTRARMLVSLRGFCGWLVLNGHMAADPTLGLESPRPPEQLPVAFLSSELEAIVQTVSVVDDRARFPWPERDRALVAVLAGAGLRASEVCGLVVADLLRDDDPVLRVLGKGNKERRVPVAAEVVEAVDDYLASRTERLSQPRANDLMFVRHNGKPFTRESLNYHVLRWLERAGVRKPPGECAHAFRHTFGKGLVGRGVALPAVQQLLGHANLNTTQVYLRMTGADLHEAVQAAEVRDFLRATRRSRA